MPDLFIRHNTPNTTHPMEHKTSVNPVITDHTKRDSVGLFSHYCANPHGVHFVNQEEDERIVLFLRKHFITNFSWIVLTVLLLLLPIVIVALFQLSNFTLFTIPPNVIAILLLFYYLVVANYALVNFIVWFYHVGIVSQRRLLDLDVYNILNHHLAETNIKEVVDVSYTQQGFAQSFFNYGNTDIQTEAIKANFEFELVPKPATVSDIITDLRNLIQRRA